MATGILRAIGAATGFTLTLRVGGRGRVAAGACLIGSGSWLGPGQFATTSP